MANNTRVLYVDDDIALVRLVQKALGRRGFAVAHAASADEALTRIADCNARVRALSPWIRSCTSHGEENAS